jgi:beta-aspartyl-peptidase (threonine type)
VLVNGGAALDAVEAAIRVLEDDPSFDAGTGSFLNADGRVQMDASIMSGANLNTGAVAAVECIRHPITLARRVLESDWALIVGPGALEFAREAGLEECDNWSLVTPEELERWSRHAGKVLYYMRDEEFYRNLLGPSGDTVGAVAMDGQGDIAAGTSTGGSGNKPPGRVGDSPVIGCGTYADNERGGVSMTGPGELVIKVVLAKHAVDLLSDEVRAQEAAERSMQYLKQRVGGVGGIIMIDKWGGLGRAKTTQLMSYAHMTEGLSKPVFGV